MRNPVAAAFSFLALGLSVACASDESQTEDDLRSFVMADAEHPEVGQSWQKRGTSTYWCTTTLVGRRTLLTAAHCARNDDTTRTCEGGFMTDSSGRGGSSAPWKKLTFKGCARRRVPGEIPGERDIAVLHLTTDADASLVPAQIATSIPSVAKRVIYGYGTFGRGCKNKMDDHKRKYVGDAARGIFATVTCPGDSGGPHFLLGTNQIIATTSGDLGIQVTGDVAKYSTWLKARIAESEANKPFTDDAVAQDSVDVYAPIFF
ncbi:MAG: trypsin-like serine protease [Polyangiaceae bacterium]